MATEHFSHAKFEIFDKIEHATLFILWKFAYVLDEPLSHEHQVNFAIVHTTKAFVSVVELRKALKESTKNIVSRWKRIYAMKHPRRARGKAPINYSDDKHEDISNQPDTLPTPSNNGGDEDNDSESVEADPNSEKDDTKVPGSVFKERISWTSLMMIHSVITLPSLARQMTKVMIPILCKKKLLFLREYLFIPPITWRNSPHLNVSIAHPSPFQNSQQPDLNFAKV